MRFYDNSMVSTHRDCPRKFMFRYVYHLVRDYEPYDEAGIPGPVYKAHYGTSWHSAMDVLWEEVINKRTVSDREVLEKSILMWERTWLERIPPGVDTGFHTLHTALEMMAYYLKERRGWLGRFRHLLASERPFAVPLEPDDKELWYCGRLDKLVEMDDGGTYVIDHKTTSQYDAKSRSKVRTSFLESFNPNSQIDGYSFGAMILYGPKYSGAFIDGALVHKNERAFPLLPIARVNDQLDAWLWETLYEIQRIELFKAELEKQKDEPYLAAFPKNTGQCWQYGPCQYLDICRGWANPVKALMEVADQTPPGYRKEEWSPFKQYHLDQISMVGEKK